MKKFVLNHRGAALALLSASTGCPGSRPAELPIPEPVPPAELLAPPPHTDSLLPIPPLEGGMKIVFEEHKGGIFKANDAPSVAVPRCRANRPVVVVAPDPRDPWDSTEEIMVFMQYHERSHFSKAQLGDCSQTLPPDPRKWTKKFETDADCGAVRDLVSRGPIGRRVVDVVYGMLITSDDPGDALHPPDRERARQMRYCRRVPDPVGS